MWYDVPSASYENILVECLNVFSRALLRLIFCLFPMSPFCFVFMVVFMFALADFFPVSVSFLSCFAFVLVYCVLS